VPVRTAVAPRTTVGAPRPAPATSRVAPPAPAVTRSVHLTNEQCGPLGLTFDVVFSDGHVISRSLGPTGTVPSVDVSGRAPYNGTFSVANPTVNC
jgi:hypothetical protein